MRLRPSPMIACWRLPALWLALAGLAATAAVPGTAFAAAPRVRHPAAGAGQAAPEMSAGPDQIQVGSLQLARCHQVAYCGRLDRPFDPSGAVPGTVSVRFELYRRRLADTPASGTFVAVEGGPGYPSSGTRSAYLRLLWPLMDSKDLLLVDNRGTGGSQVVDCAALQTEHRSGGPSVAEIAACGRQLGATAPLYSSAYAADDLAAVLAALQRGPVDLYGDSYGTYFSQVFAYRHPALLRSVVLDSAYPVPMVGGESPWYPFFAPTMNDAFNQVCAHSPSCAALPGTGMDHIQPALEALRTHPFDASAANADGELTHFRADASTLALVMLAGAPPYAVAKELEPAARAFAAGDRAPLLRLMAEATSAQDPRYAHDLPQAYSEGLFWAVSCQDYAQVYDMTLPPAARQQQHDRRVAARERRQPGSYAPFTIDEFRGMSLDYSLLDACVRWPAPSAAHPPGPLLPRQPAMPEVPVLVLNGELDTITTPPEGAAAASLFPNARHVVLANEFHIGALPPMLDDCGAELVRRFFTTLDAGDVGCAARIAPIRSTPLFARHSRELPMPVPLAGNQAGEAALKAAASAVLELGDAIARLESAGGSLSPGLRGGSVANQFSQGAYQLLFAQARFTEDVAVDGRLAWPYGRGTAVAQIVFTTAAGERGELSVSWPEQQAGSMATLSGSLAGRRLQAQMPAP